MKKIILVTALLLCAAPAWAQSQRAAELSWCRQSYRTAINVAQCFNAVEARYWPLRSPIYAGMLQRIQQTRLELARKFDAGEITEAQFGAEMKRVYAATYDAAANRYLSIYAAPAAQTPICYTSTGPLGIMTYCD